MKFFMKKFRNKSGQSMMEYAGIVILIMLGMVIGKTVIDQGAKAGIKNLTESVEESDRELIQQGPTDPSVHLPDCDCSGWQFIQCGPIGPCAERESLMHRTCSGTNCGGYATDTCQFNNSCCTAWQLVGPPNVACGVNATPLNPPNGCP